MNPDAAFLAAILERPDDEGPRLIYADYLDEQGDPRGAFIRTQCALERLPARDPRREELLAAEAHLLHRHGEEWLAPLRGLGSGFEFRRGFVERANVEARIFLLRGEELFDRAPIRHLQILDLGSLLSRVAAHPLLARLSTLTVFAQHLGARLVEALAGSPHLRNLRALNLGRNRLGDLGVRRLIESLNWKHLERLDLKDNGITDRSVGSLSYAFSRSKLRTLLLGSNELTVYGLVSLLSNLPLETLDLWRNRLDDPEAEFANVVPMTGTVRDLTLCNSGLSPATLSSLVTQVGLPQLQHLDLGWNHLGDDGVATLLRHWRPRKLRSLALRDNHLTEGAVRAIAQCPELESLEALSLGHNPIQPAGLLALIESEHLPRLRSLEISNVPVSVWHLAELTARYGRVERNV